MSHPRTARRTATALAGPAARATSGRARTAAVGAGLVALLALTGCASTAEADDAGTASAAATQTGSTVTFGRPFEYANGLFVTVKAPQEFEPSAEADGVDAGVPVRVRVQVTNGTHEPYTPSTLSATAVSAGVEATPVWDAAREVDTAGPYVTLDPGGTVSFDLGFAVADPSDLQVSLVPALGGYDPLVVTTG